MSSSGGLGGNGDVVVAEEADEADQGQSWRRAQSHVLESAGFTPREVGYHSRGGHLSRGDVKGNCLHGRSPEGQSL